jgi:hypothetical protein
MNISRDEWLAALNEAQLLPESDEQALTVWEFQEMFDLPRYTAERRLEALVRAGKATRTNKRCAALDGRVRNMRAYRLA